MRKDAPRCHKSCTRTRFRQHSDRIGGSASARPAAGAKPTSRAEVSPLRAVVIPPTGGNIVRADTATT
ncbi:hypothetical protein [Burkholderia gladioli]|uniref:hypothetical protein n=1 Tax=Burkholderia gladioli TaxID=28095 RepID=UPI00030E45FC|nr:hypothetical protein [Burkholderia gladioli]MBW5284284.1 hypothetical protein [Burkholderia gladioli]